MSAAHSITVSLALLLAGAFSACQLITPASQQPVDFVRDIKPILERSCLECHNRIDAGKMSGLNLETRQKAMTTGLHAPVIVPGAPERSVLVRVLKLGHAHPRAMPPTPDKLWKQKQRRIHQWIREGAHWPENVRLVRPQEWEAIH